MDPPNMLNLPISARDDEERLRADQRRVEEPLARPQGNGGGALPDERHAGHRRRTLLDPLNDETAPRAVVAHGDGVAAGLEARDALALIAQLQPARGGHGAEEGAP